MNIVKTSFSYHRIVILLVTVLMVFGAYALKFRAGGDKAVGGLHIHV